MTFTGKIRAYLILVALLPPLLVMTVVYFNSRKQMELSGNQAAYDDLKILIRLKEAGKKDFRIQAEQQAESPAVQRAVLLIKAGRVNEVDLGEKPSGFDFLEIVDSSGMVLVSNHRPGLVGNIVNERVGGDEIRRHGFIETVEYDINGRHAAITYIYPLTGALYMYSGMYIDDDFIDVLGAIRSVKFNLLFCGDEDSLTIDIGSITKNQLYKQDDKVYSVLYGGNESGYYLMAEFAGGGNRQMIMSIIKTTGAMTLFSIIIAILLGIYITGRAKREIDNLVTATDRVARGDFSTPVMAYEEGEFSQLADSFSDMMVRLKELQSELATTEKIAAWKSIGQKIAHEIKNPLTPIALSVDDLRQSYIEKLPGFEKTLMECTATVRDEIRRLTKLLDQFVSFARMNAPAIIDVKPAQFIEGMILLHRKSIDNGQLHIENRSGRRMFRFDPEALKQVLLNIIKNSFESGPDIHISVVIEDTTDGIEFTVEDDGPGFDDRTLERPFEPYLSSKKDGSGLGLVICQRIIHDHGGMIEIYNRPTGGAGVKFKIPF